MPSPLLTIEGIYDGKSIQPLEDVKTEKKQRVLITFLDELVPMDNSRQNGNHELAELAEQLQSLADDAGVKDWKGFVVDVLKEKAQAGKNKMRFYAITDQIREGMKRAGISEEEIQDDFNRFRRTLPRE